MLSGINLETTREIAEASGLKVTASGGVASLDDIRQGSSLEDRFLEKAGADPEATRKITWLEESAP